MMREDKKNLMNLSTQSKNQRKHKLQLTSTAVHKMWLVVDSKREKNNSLTVLIKMKEKQESDRFFSVSVSLT